MDKYKCMTEKEIKQQLFRVTCLNPLLDMECGGIKLQGMNQLCGHGTGMTIEQMNRKLIWKTKPYIRIPYCKYCYTKNTVGVFDDTPQLIGWIVNAPDEKHSCYRSEKLSEENYKRIIEYFEKHSQI